MHLFMPIIDLEAVQTQDESVQGQTLLPHVTFSIPGNTKYCTGKDLYLWSRGISRLFLKHSKYFSILINKLDFYGTNGSRSLPVCLQYSLLILLFFYFLILYNTKMQLQHALKIVQTEKGENCFCLNINIYQVAKNCQNAILN